MKSLSATVRIRLVDTTQADAAAEAIADQTIHRVSLGGDDAGDSVSFGFEAPDLSPGRQYSVAAHVDVSGNGEIEVGDYLTTESVLVEPRSATTQLEIPVRQVHS
jgi:uncharacterized lipoprotein YbaY